MSKINATDALNEAIALLQIKQKRELVILKDQFEVTYDSLKPMNLIRNTFGDFAASADIKGTIFNSLIGLATGYLTKKFLVDTHRSPVKGVFQTVFRFILNKIIPSRH